MILLDLSNVFYRCLFSLEKLNNEIPNYQPSLNELKSSMLNEINNINEKFTIDWGRLMICCDGKGNWRYGFFKEYKQKRTENKVSDTRDWDSLRRMFDEIKQDIKNNSKWPVLEVNDLEADDIIALIVKYSKDKLLIVSNDKDLNQLVEGNTKQFSLMNNDYVTKEHHPLTEAILTGDSGDGVPNIFSDDDHYVKEDKIRAKPVTKSMKEYFQDKILNEASLIVYINEINEKSKDKLDLDKIIHNYQRNKLMIDLSMIPSKYDELFKTNVKDSVDLANNNVNKHQIWISNIINNNDIKKEEVNIGDLFDE